jgi:hypothetical protein
MYSTSIDLSLEVVAAEGVSDRKGEEAEPNGKQYEVQNGRSI